MSQTASAITRSPAEIVQNSPVSQAPNGICYARTGEITIAESDLDRMIAAVPASVAATLSRKAYYFVPLTVTQGDETVIADRYDVARVGIHRDDGRLHEPDAVTAHEDGRVRRAEIDTDLRRDLRIQAFVQRSHRVSRSRGRARARRR